MVNLVDDSDLRTSAITTQQRLVARYDRAARRWHGQVAKLGYLQAYESLVAFARPRIVAPTSRPLSVLDAGAGTAAFALSFLRACDRPCELTLLDASPEMLRFAQNELAARQLKVACMVGDLSTLSQHSGEYDVVLCGHVIEHTDSPVASLASLHRALRRDGLLLLSVTQPHWCTRLLQLLWGHRAYGARDVVSWLEGVGFTSVDTFAFSKGPPSRMSLGYVATRPAGIDSAARTRRALPAPAVRED